MRTDPRQLVLDLIVVGLAVAWVANAGGIQPAVPIYPFEKINWQWILGLEEQDEVGENVRVAILPHDASSHKELTAFYRGMTSSTNPQTIVLIGPNHYNKGDTDIQTTTRAFQTADGLLPVSWRLAGALQSSGIAKIENATFLKEHAVTMEVGYIKRFFPKAEFLPVVLKENTTAAEVDRLVSWLDEQLSAEEILVLASIDFSHYLTKTQASRNDVVTLGQIKTMNLNNLPQDDTTCAFVDSPDTLRAAVGYAKVVGAKNIQVVRHDNTADILKKPNLPSTTSHFYITFGRAMP